LTNPSTVSTRRDSAEVAGLVRAFLAAFRSGPDSAARLAELRDLFVPGAVIVRGGGEAIAVYDLDSFIEPRVALLTGGTLTGFHEWEVGGRIDVFGDIAQYFGTYAKAGAQNGAPFATQGMKSMQCVRTGSGWRISAVAWDDERPGLTIPTGHASVITDSRAGIDEAGGTAH
jgi:hypothetical protein